MSLFTLPVSVADLEQLQQGIEFFTDPFQATAAANAINGGTSTVYSYAVQLLASQISLSQVAMADTALMEGVTVPVGDAATPNTLTHLTTQFLPAQVANALANGYNPTVYAAEALGLGLADNAAFNTNYVSLTSAQFVSSVAALTGMNANSIAGWLQNWTNFYTAHPEAGVTAQQAAYGATIGDAIGTALLNPTPIGPGNQPATLPSATFSLLQNQVYNALKLNGEGAYVAGVTLGALPNETPLQGEGSNTPTFTLTVGQDTINQQGQITVNGPLAGIFGNQATLTNGDSITNSGPGSENSVLNATFNGFATANGLNVDAIPTWNIQQTRNGTVTLSGGILGSTNTITGLTVLNYNDNGFGGSLNVGTAALPILPTTGGTFDGFQLTVANADSSGFGAHAVDVAMSKVGFAPVTGSGTIFVTADAVGNDGDAYGIGAGSPTVGFTTWDITSRVAGGPAIPFTNDLRIGADGNSSATKIVLHDDGSNTTLWSAGSDVSGSTNGDWTNVKDANLSDTSGFVTLTGAENGTDGLLNSNTSALLTIEGGKGNSLYDLTSLTAAAVNAAGFSIAGGSSTAGNSIVEFNNAAITGATGPVNITNISVLNDASDSQGGTINMAFWAQQGSPGAGPGLIPLNAAFPLPNGGMVQPGFELLQFLDSASDPSPTLTSDLVIQNAPAMFAINMQDMDTNGHNITVTAGPILNTADHLQVWVSDEGQVPVYTINNYTTTDIFLPTEGSTVILGSTEFVDTPVFTVNNATLNFFDNTHDSGGASDTLKLGNITTAVTPAFTDIGHTSVFLDATAPTTLTDHGAGAFLLGAADASVIDAHTTSELIMFLPDTNTAAGVTVTGSATGTNLLQGTSGTIVLDSAGNGFVGNWGNDHITGGAGADNIFGMGGNDDITLNSASSGVWIAAYKSGAAAAPTGVFVQAITDIVGGAETFVNGYGTDITTVHNFTLGPSGNVLAFHAASWATGAITGGFDFGLTNQLNGAPIVPGDATVQLVSTPGAAPTKDVALDNIATYANATAFNNALHAGGVGDLLFFSGSAGIGPGDQFHVMVAYGTGTGVNIADVDLFNQTGAIQTGDTANPNLTVTAHDVVDLVGTTSLGTLASHNIHFFA
jgi:hypothetical protein